MVEVVAAANANDLVAGVTAAFVVVVALTDVVFDDIYIVVCVALAFVVFAVDNAVVPPVDHADA